MTSWQLNFPGLITTVSHDCTPLSQPSPVYGAQEEQGSGSVDEGEGEELDAPGDHPLSQRLLNNKWFISIVHCHITLYVTLISA